MYLTEQQISNRESLFLEIIEELCSDLYNVSNDHEATEEDLYIASILMDHFVESLRLPSLDESVTWAITGMDPNTDLYEEIIDSMLDESVGSMVASAVHGVGGVLSQMKKRMAQKSASSAKTAASAARSKAQAAQQKAKASSKATGILGTIKSSFHKAKAAKLAGKAQAASLKASQAATNREAAANKAKAVQTRKSRLAQKIDTGISNIKSKVKSAITSGASRLGGAAGRLAA